MPPGLTGGVSYAGTTDGNGKFSVNLKVNREWYTKTYAFQLPPWCANPDIWESTKNNNAEGSASVTAGVLNIVLRVKPKLTGGPNSWIGYGVRCKP